MELFLQITGVILIGIAKAGFGGGIGIAAVPLFILSIPDPKVAIGMMLPILCFCDWFSVPFYRNEFDGKNILRLYPGILLGILVGALLIFFLGRFSERSIQILIGILSFAFIGYQLMKTYILQHIEDYKPLPWHGWFFGGGIGLTSTLAHAAGPVATMYLLPQNMGKRVYVGTNVVLFTLVNLSKIPFYFLIGMLNGEILLDSFTLLPVVPIGTLLGAWMNKHINETVFNGIIYSFLFLLAVKLTTGFNVFEYVYSFLPFLPGVGN